MPVEIPLTKGYVAIVDDEDAHLAALKWCADVTPTNVYAKRRAYLGKIDGKYRYRTVKLHQAVLQPPPGVQVDHRDGDGLNCRRGNLRAATNAQNHGNRRADRGNRSGFKGVEPVPGGWRARIGVKGEVIRLGRFATPVEAARAYDAAARAAFGEFACLNFPEPGGRSAAAA